MHFTTNCTPLQLSFKEFDRRCRTTLLKSASRWLLLKTTIISENIPALNMEKQELQVTSSEFRVTSYQLQVESLKARVELQNCEFKSSILIWRVMSSNPRVTGLNLRVTSSYPRVTSSDL